MYMSHYEIFGVKLFHSSNFNPISITLQYESNIIILFLSMVMDSDRPGTMNVMFTIFSDSVLGNAYRHLEKQDNVLA